MRPLSLPRLAAVTLFSAALLLAWVAGAHLHLCFDGQEPSVTLHHLADGGDHLDHHRPEQQHSDADLDLDASIRRAPENDADAPAIASTVAEALSGVQDSVLLRTASAPFSIRTAPWLLQPRPRAPPA